MFHVAAFFAIAGLSPTSDPAACIAIESDAERLSCYDEALGRSPEKIEAAVIEDFGNPAEKPVGPDEIVLDVKEVKVNRSGTATVFLTNGQVWQQLDSDRVELFISKKTPALTATIKKAALGSYRMRIEPIGRTIRVRRIN